MPKTLPTIPPREIAGHRYAPITGSGRDQFGVTLINPTLPGGREWFNRWGTGAATKVYATSNLLVGDLVDDEDPWLHFRGEGQYTIFGQGDPRASEMSVKGMYPRVYLRATGTFDTPAPGTPQWNNVEVTVYSKVISFNSAHEDWTWSGISAVVKTDHWDDTNICMTRGYIGRMSLDGRFYFIKETAHGAPNGYAFSSARYNWPGGGAMPLSTWIGYKLVARNMANNTRVQLELYRDMMEGANGGAWTLENSFIDYPGWSSTGAACAPGVDAGEVLTWPNWSIYLRADSFDRPEDELVYKWFSAREVAPLP